MTHPALTSLNHFENDLRDPVSLELLQLAKRVAKTSTTALLQGESGVGKEVFARFLHEQSNRKDAPFVAVNCAAFSESLLESELFGHEKGAFSGAHQQHQGCFERAQGGTLLLDEISEMPLSLQAKLLRVLQEREVLRVGGTKPFPVNIRVVATTNRDLAAFVKEGGFRKDLFYRLNVFPIRIPPLRDRPLDILPLACLFAKQVGESMDLRLKGIARSAAERLESHHFPGNIRELKNLIERAAILCGDTEALSAQHIRFDSTGVGAPDRPLRTTVLVKPDAPREEDHNLVFEAGARPLTDIRRDVIIATLKRFNGNRTRTAEALGITRRTIQNKLNDYEERDRERDD